MTIVKRQNGFPSLFDSFLKSEWPLTGTISDGALSQPAVNIKENPEGFNLEMAAPGLKKALLKVDIDNNLLSISYEEQNEETSEKENYSRREFNYKSFKRSFTLPDTVDSENINASYQDGVLQLSIPKKAELTKAVRQIEIK